MLRPAFGWSVLAALYAAFFVWYTPWGGPLSADEVERYVAMIEASEMTSAGKAAWRRFIETDTGNDFAMINVIDMRDTPLQVEGVEPGETSEQVMRRYAEPFLGRALRSAAHPVLLGDAAASSLDLWGIEGAESWDQGGLVRYRSRRDLLEMVSTLRESGIHAFKEAAMEKTIAYPLDPWFHAGDPRMLLAGLCLVLGLANHLAAEKRRA